MGYIGQHYSAIAERGNTLLAGEIHLPKLAQKIVDLADKRIAAQRGGGRRGFFF